jgi:cobalt-precorrin 5A hydrolase
MSGKDVLVTALPHGMDAAVKVASFLRAEVVPYDPDLFERVFSQYRAIVAVMAAGIVVRKISPLIGSKWSDPAVIVITQDLRYAVPLLGGHHGANDLAWQLCGLGITPIITTATESSGKEAVEVIGTRLGCDIVNRESTKPVNTAILSAPVPVFSIEGPAMVIAGRKVAFLVKTGEYFVGIGCRKGITRDEVENAILSALEEAGIPCEKVMVYASTSMKSHESGLIDGVRSVGGVLVFVPDDALLDAGRVSQSEAARIGLPGVAEPCALAVSRKKEIVMQKQAYGGVTIAIAR